MIAYNWKLRENLKHLKLHGMLNVLTCLMLHCDNTLRCWPLKTTIQQETGFGSVSVTDAIKGLQDMKAIILVPPDKRVGQQKNLPDTRHVYQLTGVLVIEDKASEYLHLAPEGWANVRQQLTDLKDEEGSGNEPGERQLGSPPEPSEQQGSPKATQQGSPKDTNKGSPNVPHKIVQKDNQKKVSKDSSPDKEQKKPLAVQLDPSAAPEPSRPSPIPIVIPATIDTDPPALANNTHTPPAKLVGAPPPIPGLVPLPAERHRLIESIFGNYIRTTLRDARINNVSDHVHILGTVPGDPDTLVIMVDKESLRQKLDHHGLREILQLQCGWWKIPVQIKYIAPATEPLPTAVPALPMAIGAPACL